MTTKRRLFLQTNKEKSIFSREMEREREKNQITNIFFFLFRSVRTKEKEQILRRKFCMLYFR